jgi:hypothetical protein
MKRFIAVVFLCLITTFNASATLISFTDRTAWEAAVNGDFILEDFSSAPMSDYFASPIDVGDFTVSLTGSNFGSGWHLIGTGGNNNFSGTSELQAATASDSTTTLDFDFSIYALGADWGAVSDNRTTSFFIDGIQLDIPALNGGFFGFVSDTALNSSMMTLTSGNADGFSIDNLVYAKVPEPSTIALLGLAFLGFTLGKRKKA